jgi:hypothetical protein
MGFVALEKNVGPTDLQAIPFWIRNLHLKSGCRWQMTLCASRLQIQVAKMPAKQKSWWRRQDIA